MSLTVPTLCHPDEEKSCGMCCGCYNHPSFFRDQTERRLRDRTSAFQEIETPTDIESLQKFRDAELSKQHKLVPAIPNCPFVGFLDENKIGCLVHPTQLGIDMRDCGVYDRHTCEDFLCASHSILKPIERDLVIAAISDSYTYGLVITDPNFIRELFDRVADLNRAAMNDRQTHTAEVIVAAGDYFSLKVDWPYGTDDAVLGQATVGESLETLRRPKPRPSSVWDPIVLCLGTKTDDVDVLNAARETVEKRVHAVALASRSTC